MVVVVKFYNEFGDLRLGGGVVLNFDFGYGSWYLEVDLDILVFIIVFVEFGILLEGEVKFMVKNKRMS